MSVTIIQVWGEEISDSLVVFRTPKKEERKKPKLPPLLIPQPQLEIVKI